jgi:hypothetical protein
MLRDELVAIAEVGCEVPSDVIGAGHEHVDEVVDDDRHSARSTGSSRTNGSVSMPTASVISLRA